MYEDYATVTLIQFKENAGKQHPVNIQYYLKYCSKIKLEGTYNEAEDNELFLEIARTCGRTVEHLVLYGMRLSIPVDKLVMISLLTKVTFEHCSMNNDSMLRFHQWCPNITDLSFRWVDLSDDAYDELCSNEAMFPHVKSFAFQFARGTEFDKDFLSKIDKKFPSIESLSLELESDESFCELDPECNGPYEALYFKNLKKLSVVTFGEDIECLLDHMAVCRNKLKELTFSGLNMPERFYKWIGSCKKLAKLTLRVSYLVESELEELNELPYLNTVTLDVKEFHWVPEDMLAFVRKQRRLKVLKIESDRKNKEMKYDDGFKKTFDEIVAQRKKMTIHIMFYQNRREVKVSEKGLNETKDFDDNTSDDDETVIVKSGTNNNVATP